ncbi:MAG: aldo/keto reductase, partial [Clostridia bacterium]|nr:aldo/keto reductase [Clostridia bacterium]
MAFLPENTKKLGFGLMRLPVLDGKDDRIDLDQVARMADHFLEQGYTYFDTAYPYHNGF